MVVTMITVLNGLLLSLKMQKLIKQAMEKALIMQTMTIKIKTKAKAKLLAAKATSQLQVPQLATLTTAMTTTTTMHFAV